MRHEFLSARRFCPSCRKQKLIEEFSVNRHLKSGRQKECRSCRSSRRLTLRPVPDYKRRQLGSDWYKAKNRAGIVDRRLNPARRLRTLIASARGRAKRSEIDFDLDNHLDPLLGRFLKGRCEITGIGFDLEAKAAWNSPSLDRIKPDQGYVLGNVRFVLWAVNAALGNWGEDVFTEVASAFLEKRNEPA
jgi:hypothetical protein